MISPKKLERIEKNLGAETVSELGSLSVDSLKAKIVDAETSIKQASEELENNHQFQELRESLKALSLGLREVKKRQNAIIALSLHLIEEKGA